MDNGDKQASGFTKREAFAMAAMQGMQAACNGPVTDSSGIANIANRAVAQADALLKALEEDNE